MMGDQANVELDVRLADKEKVESLVNKFGGADELDDGSVTGLVMWKFYDVNYTQLEFESTLQELSIPY
ncbi:MAG TPA: hypothetical protein DCL66_07840, partial [Gammaproteobacteria bacterium]|nr:hypothetical protein [Gammaproteobacteria bacterium]